MRYSIAFAALAAIAKAQDALSTASATSDFTIETTIPDHPADALDFEGIKAAADPTYTEVPGLASQNVPYATATAIEDAAAAITETPLTVFPAATDVAMNADGESDNSSPTATVVEKRDLSKRAACAAQPTIANTYNVDVSSYKNFKADINIAVVANAATAPDGYYQNSKNLPVSLLRQGIILCILTASQGAQSAYAYLGYDQIKTGYDVNYCATRCNKKAGCLSFNIYFERDPVQEPGFNGQCEQPAAFANIKCSYWGSVLEDKTATNTGQWRSNFQVGIAGSNSYTSWSTGGPIDGCGSPLSLNNAVMNAPLRDCQGTWTYMGYKIFTSGPYDPRLCKAACDSQNDYNRAHPPTNSDNLAICSGFGSYLLTKTNSTAPGVYPQGQMCTLYTSGWGKQYAVNTASYDDGPGGGKFTYSASYFYNVTALQPTCPVELSTIQVLKRSRLFRF